MNSTNKKRRRHKQHTHTHESVHTKVSRNRLVHCVCARCVFDCVVLFRVLSPSTVSRWQCECGGGSTNTAGNNTFPTQLDLTTVSVACGTSRVRCACVSLSFRSVCGPSHLAPFHCVQPFSPSHLTHQSTAHRTASHTTNAQTGIVNTVTNHPRRLVLAHSGGSRSSGDVSAFGRRSEWWRPTATRHAVNNTKQTKTQQTQL